ncbi:MAG: hypothetical protein ACLR7U_03705 [Ruthenibacterium lactatiformans]
MELPAYHVPSAKNLCMPHGTWLELIKRAEASFLLPPLYCGFCRALALRTAPLAWWRTTTA